jgi:hypothetical protein
MAGGRPQEEKKKGKKRESSREQHPGSTILPFRAWVSNLLIRASLGSCQLLSTIF